MHFKSFEGKPERGSPKRAIFASWAVTTMNASFNVFLKMMFSKTFLSWMGGLFSPFRSCFFCVLLHSDEKSEPTVIWSQELDGP